MRVEREARAQTLGLLRLLSACLLWAGAFCWNFPAEALPAGKAWAPMDTLRHPSFQILSLPRLESDSTGIPVVFAAARGTGENKDVLGYHWSEDRWTLSWNLGMGSSWLWPVDAPLGDQYLVWKGQDSDNLESLFFGRVIADSGVAFELVTSVDRSVARYSAAVGEQDRWGIVSDIDSTFSDRLRVFRSLGGADWFEIQGVDGQGDRGVAVASLGDSTALAAWASLDEGLRWARIEGSDWFPAPDTLAGPLSGNVRFRRNQDGSFWLGWATKLSHVSVATFKDGVWTSPIHLNCASADPSQSARHSTDAIDLSRDPGPRPAIAWGAHDSRRGFNVICVAVPADSGWAPAKELEDTIEGVGPTVAVDQNGDVWVTFMRFFTNGVFWTHTYTTATATSPLVDNEDGMPRLTWTLSEPASGSWWAVLRAEGDGPFQSVARLRAGSATQMSWTDSSAPPGSTLRYRIRRESVDTRYRWETQDTVVSVWRPPIPGLALRLSGSSPVVGTARLEVVGAAAGPLRLELYDIRGRLVGQHEAWGTGEGRDSLSVPIGPLGLRSSVYLARVRDSRGAVSAPIKLVVLE